MRDDSDEEQQQVDPEHLDIEADLDEISDYADTDEEELDPSDNIKW